MPQQERLPKRFGPFVLLRELGVGGMGAAYLGMHAETGALLVVKRMHPEFQREEVIFKRFVHEAEVAAHVRHPNVAALVAMGTIDNEPFLATEYVFGIQVTQIVDRIESSQIDPVPLPIGLSLAVDLASGVEAIHGARHRESGAPLGLIHRDIGSRNVLIGFDGTIRIIDLGLGKSVLADWQTASQVLAGSPDYMAPEQAMGGRVDGRADIYSAAVTVWELLAGRKRIREEGVAARLTRAIQAQPEPLIAHRHEASKKLEAILQQAMNPDPEQRTGSAALFRKALQGELRQDGHRATQKDVAAWLDAACATVIAREKRLLEEARAKALAMGSSGEEPKTEMFVGRPERELKKDTSPYNFYTGAAFQAEGAADTTPLQPIDDVTSPSKAAVRRGSGDDVRYAGSSNPTISAIGAAGGPEAFDPAGGRTRRTMIVGAAFTLFGIAVAAGLLASTKRPAVQVTALPEGEDRPAKPNLDSAEVVVPKNTAAEGGNEEAAAPASEDEPGEETGPAHPKPHAPESESGARALAPEVESRKSDLVRRIRRLRRVRFDISFQRRVTQLSTRLSMARTMKALDEVERALARLEGES